MHNGHYSPVQLKGQRPQPMFYLLVFLVLAHNLVRTSFSELIFSSPKHRAPKLIEHLARALLELCQSQENNENKRRERIGN